MTVAQGHRHGAEILSQQGTTEGHLVIADLTGAHFDRARLPQRGVESEAHSGGVSAVVDTRRGVSLATVHQAEGEAALPLCFEQHVLNLSLSRSAVLQVFVSESAGFTDHRGAANVLPGHAANELDQVAMAIAAVSAVKRDLNVAGRHSTAIGGKHFYIGSLELGDGFGWVFGVVGVLPGRGGHRVIEHIELEALKTKSVGEGDAVALVDRGARSINQCGDHAGRGSIGGLKIAADGQTLEFIDSDHSGLCLTDAAVGHKKHVVLATNRWCGEDESIGFVNCCLA